jgi:N-acetylglucosamine-6-phosphate deacetylase
MGYFDLQVNGYGGVDFNQDALSPEQLHAACQKLLADGVEGILLTLITEKIDAMILRLRKIVGMRDADDLAKRVIHGFHVEGPFITSQTGFAGAHPKDAVLPASPDLAAKLLDAGHGLVRLLTLAPECDAEFKTTSFLTKQNVIVSAGHTDATIDQLKGAIDHGLTMFTHLGNGCPMQMHRHDNIVQRALFLRDRLWLCFIADGVHVPFPALSNYLDLIGREKAIIVTDCIAPAGLGPGRYSLGRWDVKIGDDMVARAPDGSHFLGSGVTMQRSYENLRAHAACSEEECNNMLWRNPRKAIGIDR